MTAALAVLLAVLAAALGLPHSTNTGRPDSDRGRAPLYARTGSAPRGTARPMPRRAHGPVRDPCGTVCTGAGDAAAGRHRKRAGVSSQRVDERADRSDPRRRRHRDFGPVVCDLGTTTHVASAGGVPLPAAGTRVPGWPAGRGVTRAAACCVRTARSSSSLAGISRRIGSISSRRAHETPRGSWRSGDHPGGRRLRKWWRVTGAAVDRSSASVLAWRVSSRRGEGW